MRNDADRFCRDNQNTHFMFNTLLAENRAICEIMWKTMVQPDRLHSSKDVYKKCYLQDKNIDTRS